MVKKKGKSKRVTLKDKYKIEKRVTEHNRKQRKQSKKDAQSGKVMHKKKDPGIPNSWPFKEQLLAGLEAGRERDRLLEERRRVVRKQGGADAAVISGRVATGTTMESLVANAGGARAAFEAQSGTTTDSAPSDGAPPPGRQSRRAHLRTLKQVVEASDVILQVLDARDPEGTRISSAAENSILSNHSRKMVLVLNKVDLVPSEAAAGWLRHLRKSRPVVAVRAATSSGKVVGRARGKAEGGALDGSSAAGIDALLHLLKNYARGPDGKRKGSITVGLVGYPNVGKSSVINSLVRRKSASVSPRPGHTTSMQTIVLDSNVRLIDSPGVVFDDGPAGGEGQVLLRNCIDTESIADPVAGVEAMLKRVGNDVSSLMMAYDVPRFGPGDSQAFLAAVARRLGKVVKGGIPDRKSAARAVLSDWNSGKVPYFAPPPEETAVAERAGGLSDAVVLTEFSKEFDVDNMLRKYDDELMRSLKEAGKDEMDFVRFGASPETDGAASGNLLNVLAGNGCGSSSDEEMEEEGEDEDEKNGRCDDSEMDDGTSGKQQAQKRALVVDNKDLARAEDFDFTTMM